MSGVVIIGAGHAAGQAAASLRQAKYEGDITIIGDEAHIPYQRPPRSSGSSSWKPHRLWLYALDGLFSFSVLPLKFWTLLGVVISLLSLIYAFYELSVTLLFGIDVPGWTTLVVAIFFLGGVQLIGIGILGEYIGRIYMESKRRPTYFVRRIHSAPDSRA